MDAQAQERLHQVGEDYWWLEGTYQVVESLLARYVSSRLSRPVIVDCAAGPGHFTKRLQKFGRTFASDLTFEALRFAKAKGHTAFSADARRIPLQSESVDVLLMLDALEHIQEEEEAEKELYRVLKKDGLLFVTVPAYQFLWGAHDTMYGHVRRYRASEMAAKLRAAGFKIEKKSYIKCVFFFPVLAVRFIKNLLRGRIKEQDDFYQVPGWANKILTLIFSFESWWLRRFNFPFGVSIVCVARKTELSLLPGSGARLEPAVTCA